MDLNIIIATINQLLSSGKYQQAIDFLTMQEGVSPTVQAQICYLKAEVFRLQNRTDLAIQQLKSISGNHAFVNFALGNLLEKRGLIEEALQVWMRSLDQLTSEQFSVLLQAALKCPTISSNELLLMQRIWAKKFCRVHFTDRYNEGFLHKLSENIRIGYHCTFWNSQTIRHQLVPHIRCHDKSKYTVYAYSSGPLDRDLQDAVDHIRIVGNLNDHEFVKLVRADKIDILVECTGYSPGHRFAAMAARCAPIQVSYLNHTGTSGVPNIDYIFADETALSRDEDEYFTETVVRLPGSFFSFNFEGKPHPDPSAPPLLKNGFVTFGCFGSHGKINETLISWWAEILKRVPNSRLYVRNLELSSADNREFFTKQLEKIGIPRERLQIRGGAERDEIVASYAEVDISLDTWPYSGGNTIAESMWQGVPVITCRGKRFASSYGSSLIEASGCGELIAYNQVQYVQRAVDLANDPKALGEYRVGLRKKIVASKFNNPGDFCRKLEVAYSHMVRKVIDIHQGAVAGIEKIRNSISEHGFSRKTEIFTVEWPKLYAKGSQEIFNRYLLDLALRGLGVNNSEPPELTGEKWLAEQLPELLSGIVAPVIFDVGAHTGESTRNFARVFPNGVFHLFEPLPTNLSVLLQSVPLANCTVNPLALSDIVGKSRIFNHSDQNGRFCPMHASLIPEVFSEYYHSDSTSFDIEVSTLDKYCSGAGITVIDFLKIDTEGNELKVLSGAKALIQRRAIRYIQFEFNYTTAFAHAMLSDFIRILPNYTFYRLLPRGLLVLENDDIMGNSFYNLQNILAVREEDYHSIRRVQLKGLQENRTATARQTGA